MPVFGLNNGITPIIAYNYGARHRKRMLKTVKVSMFIAFCFTFIGFLAFEFIPKTLLGLFSASEYAYHRNPCTSYHRNPLSDRMVLYHCGNCIPGTRKSCIQYDRIYHASAVCPGTCCLYPCFHRRTSRSMVVFPHCGDHFSDRVRSFPGCHKQNDHSKNSGSLRTSKLPIQFIQKKTEDFLFLFRISSVFLLLFIDPVAIPSGAFYLIKGKICF